MDNYIWMFNKKEDRALGWTFLCSLALHFLLFTILVIRPIYPLSGEAEKLDIIWLYPALQPTSEVKAPVRSEHEVPSAVAVREDTTASTVTDSTKEESKKEALLPPVQHHQNAVEEVEPAEETPEPQPVTEMVAVKIETKKVETLPDKSPAKTKIAQIKSAAEAVDLKSKVVQNVRAGFENISVARERKRVKETEINKVQATNPGKIAEQTRETKNKAMPDNGKAGGEPELKKQTSRTEPTAAKPNQALQAKAPSERIIGQQVSTIQKPVQSTSRSGIDTNSAELKSAPERPVVDTGNSNQRAAAQGPSAQNVPGPKPLELKPVTGAKNEKPSDLQRPGITTETKGILIPPVMGDLKLEVTGTTNLKITAVFNEYFKTRHNRPITKAEAKRIQSVTLKYRTRENSIEAVVGTAGEGVYDFIIEPVDDKPVHAVFVVKVHEAGSKAKTRSFGAKTVKEKVVVTKILMPEGIFWDDDAYFSGNMEDSESITKYNTDTGVIWKEYHH